MQPVRPCRVVEQRRADRAALALLTCRAAPSFHAGRAAPVSQP
jgi:hypothetical protein